MASNVIRKPLPGGKRLKLGGSGMASMQPRPITLIGTHAASKGQGARKLHRAQGVHA